MWGDLHQDKEYTVGIGIFVSLDLVFIDGILLYYYVKGLFMTVRKCYFPKITVDNLTGDRIHELILEATSYVVLFGILILTDFAMIFVIWMTFSDEDQRCREYMYFTEFAAAFEIIMTLTASHLSFKFSHDLYRKRCKYCHKCVYGLFLRFIRKRYQTLLMGDSVDNPYYRM